MTILYTSLNEIKSFNPCNSSWRAILQGQGKTEADDTPIVLVDCLESNSTADICWLLDRRKIEINICVSFAHKCADSVKHLNNKYADAAADAAAADAAADAAYNKQKELNKSFLIQCIKDYESTH